MPILRLLLLAFLFGCANDPDRLAFDDFPLTPTTEAPSGTPLASEPLSAMPERARELREGSAPEADFAGTYAVVSWGCGSLCSMHAVIDTETSGIVGTFESPLEVVYRADSRLLLVNPSSVPLPVPTPGLSEEARVSTRGFALHDGVLYDLGLYPR